MNEANHKSQTVVSQLRHGIEALIERHALRPGDQIPTEGQLSKEFGVSRPALREALKLLEEDGLIRVVHGKGRFVAAGAALQIERPITRFESVSDMVRSHGYRTRTSVLGYALVAADDEVAEGLRCKAGTRVVRVERLRSTEDKALIYSVDYVRHSDIAANGKPVDWTGSIVELLGDKGLLPTASSATVAATLLPPDVARLHELQDFGPALLIVETCFSADGEAVLFAKVYHRGESFAFSFARK